MWLMTFEGLNDIISASQKSSWIFRVEKALSWASTNAESHSVFRIWYNWILISDSIAEVMNFFRESKMSMFKDWVKWDECGGKIMRIILFFMQWAIHEAVIWLSCPSQIKRRGWPFAFSWVSGSNTWRSHCNPCTLLVHPFVLQPNLQLLWILAGIHWRDRFSPLNIIKGGSEVPSAQTHSIDVTHSWRPGFAWNAWWIIALIICCCWNNYSDADIGIRYLSEIPI